MLCQIVVGLDQVGLDLAFHFARCGIDVVGIDPSSTKVRAIQIGDFGEMSLVGPRPERPEFVVNFKKDIPHYQTRHNIKPGMTGWAQVKGLRGDTDLLERINCDVFYLENWSFLLDLQVTLMTFLWKQERMLTWCLGARRAGPLRRSFPSNSGISASSFLILQRRLSGA